MSTIEFVQNPLEQIDFSNGVVITDENVAKLVDLSNVAHIIIPAGEKEKTRARKEWIEDLLLQQKRGRDLHLIALGGGVVSDITGFIAATYCRGVKFSVIPTTLLAMVDAAIGGKNGVNTPFSKNSIGTIYMPSTVYIDFSFLETLPQEEIENGMAEVIKHALIQEMDDFIQLENGTFDLRAMIQKSIAIKTAVIECDQHEKAYRRILNFGHTTAHAIEKESDYSISHGMAVLFGMCVATALSPMPKQEKERVITFLIPRIICEIPEYSDKLYQLTLSDKKALGENARFVLLDAVGSVAPFDGEYVTSISPCQFQAAYKESLSALHSYHRAHV